MATSPATAYAPSLNLSALLEAHGGTVRLAVRQFVITTAPGFDNYGSRIEGKLRVHAYGERLPREQVRLAKAFRARHVPHAEVYEMNVTPGELTEMLNDLYANGRNVEWRQQVEKRLWVLFRNSSDGHWASKQLEALAMEDD
jgi:hypothetical protein